MLLGRWLFEPVVHTDADKAKHRRRQATGGDRHGRVAAVVEAPKRGVLTVEAAPTQEARHKALDQVGGPQTPHATKHLACVVRAAARQGKPGDVGHVAVDRRGPVSGGQAGPDARPKQSEEPQAIHRAADAAALLRQLEGGCGGRACLLRRHERAHVAHGVPQLERFGSERNRVSGCEAAAAVTSGLDSGGRTRRRSGRQEGGVDRAVNARRRGRGRQRERGLRPGRRQRGRGQAVVRGQVPSAVGCGSGGSARRRETTRRATRGRAGRASDGGATGRRRGTRAGPRWLWDAKWILDPPSRIYRGKASGSTRRGRGPHDNQ